MRITGKLSFKRRKVESSHLCVGDPTVGLIGAEEFMMLLVERRDGKLLYLSESIRNAWESRGIVEEELIKLRTWFITVEVKATIVDPLRDDSPLKVGVVESEDIAEPLERRIGFRNCLHGR